MKTKYADDMREERERRKSLLLIAALVVVAALLICWIVSLQKDNIDEVSVQTSRTAFTNTSAPLTQGTTLPQNTTVSQNGVTSPSVTAPKAEKTMTNEEIIAIFNKSANAVKTDGVRVIKNYEKRSVREEYVEISVLRDTFINLLKDNFKDNMEAVLYEGKEKIIEKYPVPKREIASTLTSAEVESASCTDNGDTYEITIVLHPSDNPAPDTGVAKAFETQQRDDVMKDAPDMIRDFSLNYVDCSVKTTVDKKTGRAMKSTYSYTVITKVVLDVGVMDLDAQLGIAFERDYSVIY